MIILDTNIIVSGLISEHGAPAQLLNSWTDRAFSLATAVFGGFTPAIATYLIELTQNRAIPGVWLSFAALSGLT